MDMSNRWWLLSVCCLLSESFFIRVNHFHFFHFFLLYHHHHHHQWLCFSVEWAFLSDFWISEISSTCHQPVLSSIHADIRPLNYCKGTEYLRTPMDGGRGCSTPTHLLFGSYRPWFGTDSDVHILTASLQCLLL